MEGLFISMLIHGIYDFFMDINLYFSFSGGFYKPLGISPNIALDKFVLLFSNSNTTYAFAELGNLYPVSKLILPIYLVFGIWYLSFLLSKKENLEDFGHLEVKKVYIASGQNPANVPSAYSDQYGQGDYRDNGEDLARQQVLYR
jgi:hypothetical protein